MELNSANLESKLAILYSIFDIFIKLGQDVKWGYIITYLRYDELYETLYDDNDSNACIDALRNFTEARL